ncbi:chromatin assembly factor 1 subunit A [Bradysia coprophila]|uniref:chromatin assembly factor 1 subunit A n=1 Tax=Bradysia coprophila TaxID=38358 RepID=UPI00187D7F21|nr:chromatin assembly factor 1 subunit A [Bradysia coprophila]
MSEKKDKIPPTTDVSNTPNGKKMKQTRIPFKPLESSSKEGTSSPVTGESRKRKLSTTEDDDRSMKLSKIGAAKENIAKTDEVTVLDMVDLVEDIDMPDNEITASDVLPKETKKSTKDVAAEGTPLRRSSRRIDSEVPAKVVIKIPSAKKKKVNERPSKVVVDAKIEETDEDDDVILIDSEENSLNSIDGKEKGGNDIVPTEDESSFVLDGDSGSNSNITESTEPVAVIPSFDAADSNVTSSDNHESDVAVEKEVNVVPDSESENVSIVEADINQLDATVAGEEKVSSSSALSVSDKIDESHGKEETLLASANEANSSDLESNVDNNRETEMDTDFDQSKVSTPTSSKVGRRTRKSVDAMNSPKTPAMKTTDKNALTPKQMQKKLESEQKRMAKEKAKEERERKIQEAKEERERKILEAKEERERKIQEAKEERERKIQEEKEQRQKERDEKERIKKKERDDKEEQKRKEREDKEEQRRKEKEEREKKKQAEIDAKNEEKRLKEEERVAKEEAELKKKRKEAEAFTKFFAKKSNKSSEYDKMDVDDVEVTLNFMPFRVKPDMRLAPIVRRQLSPTRKSQFDGEVLNSTESRPTTDLYIQSLRNGGRTTEKQGKTWPSEDNNDDVILLDELEGSTSIEESSAIQKYRAKFFKFEENRRPPYYGTWQKKSSVITPRRPFATDEKFFDYEIDSDDEWEDEEPGESLHGSDDEKDKESDDDYDIDNEFFVPHGHLSDEELANNDEIDEDNSPDTQKAKLKIMQKVFSDEMKKKTEKIKPRLIGLIWQNKDGNQPLGCPSVIWEMLLMRSMIFNGPTIKMPIIQSVEKNDATDDNGEAKKGSAVKKRIKLAEESVPDLLRLIHGNTNSSEFLSKEFRAFTAQKNKDDDKFQEFSLTSIRLKIKELAEWKPCPEEGPMMNKLCWYVASEQRKHYNLEDLSVINDWTYTLTPKSKTKSESKKAKENEKVKPPPDAPDEPPSSAKTPKSKLGNIEKFTKVLSDDDKKKNFSIVQEDVPSAKPKTDAEPSPKPAKKRVKLLMSVPRGQEIPVQTKNSLISQYLSSTNASKKSTNAEEPICIDD